MHGVIATNPVRGVRRPADRVRDRHLSIEEYRVLGEILGLADEIGDHGNTVAMVRLLALTGCRRGEIINLRCDEVYETRGCFRLRDSKEGSSTRPIGRAAFDILAQIRPDAASGYVFPGAIDGKPFLGFPKAWASILKDSDLPGVTPHLLRHSFASTANELGFTEATIAAMLGHSRGTVTSRYVHHVDAALVAAADVVASQISSFIRSRRSIQIKNTADARSMGVGTGQIYPAAAE
jgi:integrase